MVEMSKPKTCSFCKSMFTPVRALQKVCCGLCALEHTRQQSIKKAAKAEQAERKATRVKLDALRTKPQLVKLAQTAFNIFIRARDAGKPCISCGRALSDEPNSKDAGHYRSTGSAVHMRFVESNCHAQCKRCNRDLSGNAVEYRKGLIERVGVAEVERLERDQTLRKYTKEGLLEIAKHYREQAKKLKENYV